MPSHSYFLKSILHFSDSTYNEQNGVCTFFIVFAGEKLNYLPAFGDTESSFVGWYDNEGNPFDADCAITEDIQIYAKFIESPLKPLKRIVKLVPLAVIAVFFIILAVIELKRIPKKRVKKDG